MTAIESVIVNLNINIAVVKPSALAETLEDGVVQLEKLCAFAKRNGCSYLIAPQIMTLESKLSLTGEEFGRLSPAAAQSGVNTFFSYYAMKDDRQLRYSAGIKSDGSLAMAFSGLNRCDFSAAEFKRMGGNSAEFMLGGHVGVTVEYEGMRMLSHSAVIQASGEFMTDTERFKAESEAVGCVIAKAFDDITGSPTTDYREKGMGNPINNVLWILNKYRGRP